MNNFTYSLVCFLFFFVGFNGFSQDLGLNLAFEQPTSQSSTGWEGHSWKAVDGNTSGVFDNDNLEANSVTHTAVGDSLAWWRVDLGDIYDISVIRIYNRAGEENGRLTGATVFVGDIESSDTTDYRQVGDPLTLNLVQIVQSDSIGLARYIMIRQSGILSLAEVEVYGNSTTCPPVNTSCDDNNPNTINDVEDGNCNCVGTVVVCEDLVLDYQLNGGSTISGATEVTVNVGDNVELLLNIEGIEYTIIDPDDNELSSPVIENITSAQSGLYSIISTLSPVVLSVDSEELYNEDGRALNAVDGNEGTIWHTEWSLRNDPYPHEIVIDLRAISNVSGFEYLPRQDGETHGMIAEYEIYVSNSTDNWGAPVDTGTWTYDNTLKTVAFPEKQGRYVRLVALSEGAGNHWASAAEIRVVRTTEPCVKTIQINVGTAYIYDGSVWLPSDPNMGGVGLNDSIRIDSGEAVISSNITCYNVAVAAGAALTINSGVTLTANTTTLQSTSEVYSSLIVNGNLDGVVSYNRYVNKIGTSAGGGNDLISSPVVATFNTDFVTENEGVLAKHPTTEGIYGFGPFNVEAGAYQNFNIGPTNSGSFPLVPGSGYRAATIDGGTLNFTGITTNTSVVNVPVSDAVPGRAWNLIGNPYPSYIDVNAFFTSNNVAELQVNYVAIYGYTGSSNSWTIYNQATTAPETLITPGQGFFVKVNAGAEFVEFTPSMRRVGTSDDFILGRPASLSKVLSKIKLSNAASYVSTSIYFIDGTTRGLDPGYDAAAYSATELGFSVFTNLLEDHTGLDIAIQSLPYNDFNDVVVPLGMKARAGEELSISIDELSTLPSNINVYLEDVQNKTLTLLNTDAFVFTPTTDMNGAGRFNVHYSSRTLSIEDMPSNDNLRIYTTVVPKALVISGQLRSTTTANLYDIQGRLVLSKMLNPNTTENVMDISTVNAGIYVVKFNNDSQTKAQKVIIK